MHTYLKKNTNPYAQHTEETLGEATSLPWQKLRKWRKKKKKPFTGRGMA